MLVLAVFIPFGFIVYNLLEARDYMEPIPILSAIATYGIYEITKEPSVSK
jgi:hypothetical protein